MIAWKSTCKEEYPENGQLCLIYFEPIGFCVSHYRLAENDEYVTHLFEDEQGWLGDEMVLWVLYDDIMAIGLEEANKVLEKIPQDYLDLFPNRKVGK